MSRARLKAAVQPFVAALPALLREPLRAFWRALPGYQPDPEPSSPADGTAEQPSAFAETGTTSVPAPPPAPQGVPSTSATGAAVPSGEPAAVDASLPEAGAPEAPVLSAYEQRIAQETLIFNDQVEVHDLPAIFHYWSNTYLLPVLQSFGCQHPEDFLALHLFESAQRCGVERPRFVSLGCGNCDAEVRIALDLVRRGLTDFTFECLDINPAMLERGRMLALEAGLEGRIVPLPGDFNHWIPDGQYDGIMANQSLHHVLELESLFDAVRGALKPEAGFVVSDMIGRNGHQRWPEAAAIVREFWRELPPGYRYNLQLQRQEDGFIDWDCSVEGFEGVRAQDIQALLLERFHFEVFIGFGNVIDPFIDRGFGHHFDVSHAFDRFFIDRVHARDEAEMLAGTITPTHMLAVLRTVPTTPRHRDGLAPERCVRPPLPEPEPEPGQPQSPPGGALP